MSTDVIWPDINSKEALLCSYPLCTSWEVWTTFIDGSAEHAWTSPSIPLSMQKWVSLTKLPFLALLSDHF